MLLSIKKKNQLAKLALINYKFELIAINLIFPYIPKRLLRAVIHGTYDLQIS